MRQFTRADREVLADPVFRWRYQRASEHDASADGYFVTGFPMSETFCRPGCSTRTPRPSYVAFYPTPAAAHAAGLTPCPRCRPDSTCLPPALAHGDSLGARALRLIVDGVIERTGVEGLAADLGVTSRHVLRAVTEVAGCGPLSVSRAARAHMARLLLSATSVSVGEVALASGFGTVRQFNSSIARLYGTTPSTLRFGPRRHSAITSDPGYLQLRCQLPVRKPYDAHALFQFLAAESIADVEEGAGRWYGRTVRLPRGVGYVRLDSDNRGGLLAMLRVMDSRDIIPLYGRTRALVDADAEPNRSDEREPSGFTHDYRMGTRVPGSIDLDETILRAAIGQGLTPAKELQVLGDVTRQLGEATPWGLLFPTAATIAERARDAFAGRTVDVAVVEAVARAIASHRLVVHRGSARADVVRQLSALGGLKDDTITRILVRIGMDRGVLRSAP